MRRLKNEHKMSAAAAFFCKTDFDDVAGRDKTELRNDLWITTLSVLTKKELLVSLWRS